MRDLPRYIKRMLREHVALAYEEELRRALLPLADDFDRWRRGEMASAEMSHRIHLFHQGPAREIWKTYNLGAPTTSVAYAVHSGILDREQLPPELLEALRGVLVMWESLEAPAPEEEREEDQPGARPRS